MGKDSVLAAVDRISQNGATDMFHVNSDLVGAACFQPETHERKWPVAGNATIHRVGKFSLGGIGASFKTLSVLWVANQLSLDVARSSGRSAHHNGDIFFFNPSLLKLLL